MGQGISQALGQTDEALIVEAYDTQGIIEAAENMSLGNDVNVGSLDFDDGGGDASGSDNDGLDDEDIDLEIIEQELRDNGDMDNDDDGGGDGGGNGGVCEIIRFWAVFGSKWPKTSTQGPKSAILTIGMHSLVVSAFLFPKFNPLHDTGDEEYGEQDDDPQDAPLMALEKEAEQETAAFEVDDNTIEKEDDVIEADHVAAALGDIDDLLIEEAAQAVDAGA